MIKNVDALREGTFVVLVLWLHGWSAGSIALLTRKSRSAVAGIAKRNLEKSRDEMTAEERQAALRTLAARRKDGGKLDSAYFVARPLRAVQGRKIPVAPRPKAVAQAARPAARPLSKQERKKARKKEREDQRLREQGHAQRRGDRSSALEYLVFVSKALVDRDDASAPTGERGLSTSGMRRLEAGLVLRRYIDGSRIGGLGSVNYESSSGGSRVGLPPQAYKLFCIDALGSIRKTIGQTAYEVLDAIVDRDDFLWERIEVTGADLIEPAERFYALARAMDERIAHYDAPRPEATPRQRIQAATARIEADRLKRTQAALYALGAAHDAGRVSASLRAFDSRKAVYDMLGTVVDLDGEVPVDTGIPEIRGPEAAALWALARRAEGTPGLAERSAADRATRAKQRALERTYDVIRRGLDAVAAHEGLMSPADFRLRWGIALAIPERVRRFEADARAEIIAAALEIARSAV